LADETIGIFAMRKVGKRMGKFFIMETVAAAAYALLLVSPALAGGRLQSPGTTEERAVRARISEWVEAYRNLDAKRLAALETPAVEVVDRFGQVRLPSASENEKLWSDTFEAISRKSTPPTVTVDHIEFLRPDVALVQMSWQFSKGILLVDGDRIPPYSEVDTYVVTKVQGVWLVAAHNMQEKKS
jgi:uncharacterized protein (TIGR02246 family)